MGLIALAMLGFALFSPSTPYWYLLITICVMSGGMALTMSPMTTELMSAVPRDRAGIGSAMNDTTRELGGALGVAVLGSLVTSQYTSGLADTAAALPEEARELAQGSIGGVLGLISRGILPADVGEQLLGTARSAFVDGLNLAGIIAAAVVLAAAVTVRSLLPSRRRGPMATPEAPPSPWTSRWPRSLRRLRSLGLAGQGRPGLSHRTA